MEALGTKAFKSSKRFLPRSVVKTLIPVALPPGRLKLGTSPNATGSAPTMNTTGMVLVVDVAASALTFPPVAAITFTRRDTKSEASSGSRS